MLHSVFCPCVGVIGATFAVGACLSARFREKDDYKNAVVGGMLAGLIFGYKSKCPITCVIELIVQALHGLVPPHCRTNISEHKIHAPLFGGGKFLWFYDGTSHSQPASSVQ